MIAITLLLVSMNSVVSSLTCGLPSAPADATPALQACLATHGQVNLVGYYTLNTTLVMPQGSVLSSDRGIYQNALTAGATLSGPMIKLDSNVSTVVENVQLLIPVNSTAAGAILITNNTWNAQFNRVSRCYIEDASKGSTGRYGIKLHSTGPWQIAYNEIDHNTVFQFAIALHASGSTTYPVTANHLIGNRTSGVSNIQFDIGVQQSNVDAHFCNGFAGVPTNPTCVILGNALAMGSVHENVITVHSDITGSFGMQGLSYRLYASAQKNTMTMLSSDGNGIPPAATTGLPAIVGNANTITYK